MERQQKRKKKMGGERDRQIHVDIEPNGDRHTDCETRENNAMFTFA